MCVCVYVRGGGVRVCVRRGGGVCVRGGGGVCVCVERMRGGMWLMSVLDKMHDETRIKLCTPLAIYGN